MKLKDRLPGMCRELATECIEGNREGFDCYPPGEPKMWWCWTTILGIRLVVVVDGHTGTWHLKGGK